MRIWTIGAPSSPLAGLRSPRITRSLRYLLAASLLFCYIIPPPVRAQTRESALSDGEVEKLRETADEPALRVLAFISFLNQRTAAIEKLTAGKRRPGREEDLHEMMDQITSIANDLDDNLDDYGTRHHDIRKSLPKLTAAAERWASILKGPVENSLYEVSRKLALESITDVREAATKLLPEQQAYFLAHPPSKSDSSRPVESESHPF